MIFSAIDSALGVGAILPGETAVVLAAIALAGDPGHVALAILAAAAGAFIGDHIRFAVGRVLGPRLEDTKLIRRLGHDKWDEARSFVAGRFWVIILAQLMPGVRTFVSAAAGASSMRYGRFAIICGAAAAIWATIWVIGGVTVGSALLDFVDNYTLPSLAIVYVAASRSHIVDS
jgi:membrane-associated protein